MTIKNTRKKLENIDDISKTCTTYIHGKL